jgi:D-alanyl-D-alanine carboxypeptidase/D-alanyl-D-alanine-endopeptidase (penicillin-binding protein 4)
MKKYVFLLLIISLSAVSWAQETTDSVRVVPLSERLDSLLRDPMFETSRVGLMVYDLTADSLVYQLDASQLLRPASTMKLVTAITALDFLGTDYQYRTRIYYQGDIVNGKLSGDLYCVGGFDPMLTGDDIEAFVECLQEQGIDTLCGRIVVDNSVKEDVEFGEGWCWDDDNPHLWPLSIGRKDIFVEQLMQTMTANGIVLSEVSKAKGRLPGNAVLICTRFHSIDQVLGPMMKKSDNFYAESMFYQIAASEGGRHAKASDAAKVMKRLFRKVGLGHREYRIADGSGLSLYNYVSAELETALLRYAWRHRDIYDHLYPSLPVAGIDGTLSKRMKETAALENVHAKTGTVTGVSSLAGYCLAANGHELCFSIINQGIMDSSTGRDFQDRVCHALCE